MSLKLGSPAFSHNATIPRQYTCDGEDRSPPLHWEGGPAGTRSFALIVDDPDAPDPAAPQRTYVHWILYDLPASLDHLEEGQSPASVQGRDGTNDRKTTGYSGPCPPIGRHRYFFKLYALDVVFGDLAAPSKSDLERAMATHILDRAELVGTYQREGRP
jgi:Raf kinase inhibitor-like YbhB/YbcL family protein